MRVGSVISIRVSGINIRSIRVSSVISIRVSGINIISIRVSSVIIFQLIQLNDELEKKDERISELETQLLQVLNHQDSVTMTTQSVCPHCTSCQNSSVVTKEIISSPMTTANSSINSDHITAPRSLSPINEGTDDKINPRQVGGASVRSGNHSNNTTPRRKISSSVLDREQQEVNHSANIEPYKQDTGHFCLSQIPHLCI